MRGTLRRARLVLALAAIASLGLIWFLRPHNGVTSPTEAAPVGRDPALALVEGVAFEEAGEWIEALDRYAESEHPQARLARARLLESLGRPREALDELNRAVEPDFEFRGAIAAARARVLLRLGREEEARDALTRDALRGYAARPLAELAGLQIRRRQWQAAMNDLITAQANASTAVRSGEPPVDLDGTGFIAAEVLVALGHRDEAIVTYHSLLQNASDPAWRIAAHTGLARLATSREAARSEMLKAREALAEVPGARWLEPLVARAESDCR